MMLRKLPPAVVCLLLFTGLAAAQSREERDVRAVLDRMFKMANTIELKDAQATLADHSRSGGPFFPAYAQMQTTLAEIEKTMTSGLAELASRSYKASGPIVVRADKNVAYAAFPWRLDVVMKDGSRFAADGRATVTFAREGKGWKIVHWHSSLPTPPPATRAMLAAETEAILATERRAVEALKAGQPDRLNEYFAESFSMFQPDQAYRTRGTRAENVRNAQSWLENTTLRAYQMLEPSVELLGDTAILTYYFTMTTVTAGKETSDTGKATVVFRKENGQWRAAHEHISTNR
jgi:ketosteroid isomerase-like protein